MSTATVTLLFCDLVRSTELLGRLGGADADRVRQACFQALRGAVSESGGTEVKSLGDGLMVAFTSAVDGVRCAAAMQQAMTRLNRREPGLDLALRVGVSVGEATSEGGDWFGAPVIEAARLCHVADAGQIVASALVETLAGQRQPLTSVPLGALELKGLDAPVAAVEILWSSGAAAGRLPGPLATASAGLFVGRHAELGHLTDGWKAATRGITGVAFVAGEPGIGKTRLAAELARRAAADGGIVLYGRCDEDLGVPYQPFAEALRGAVTGVHGKAVLDSLGPTATRLVPLLPTLADGEIGPSPVFDQEGERYRMFEAVEDLLAALADRGPVLLVLDDLHWAAQPTLLLLRHLARATNVPMLTVATYRDTEVDRIHPVASVLADLRRDGEGDRIKLDGLGADDVRSFLEASTGGIIDGQVKDVATRLHAETEGNPFFVTEMVRHVNETGQPYAAVATAGLPDSVREVVTRRLARLTPAANSVLEVAAVCGPEFALDVLEAVAGDPADAVVHAVDEAIQARILVEVEPGVLTFTHSLVRQSLYWSISGVRRIRLHRRVAEVLATTNAAPALLLSHFAEAAPQGGAVKAVDYALVAAREATTRLAAEEAVTHLRTGLSALDRYGPADPARHAELLVTLAEALFGVWEWKEAVDVAAQAAREAREIGDGRVLARAAIVTVMATPVGGPDEAPARMCDEALALLGADENALRSRILAGRVAYSVGVRSKHLDDVRGLADEALRLARTGDDDRALADALFAQSAALRLVGAHRDVIAACDELIAIADRTRDPFLRALGLSDRARTWLTIGDREHFEADRTGLHALGHEFGGQYERWARQYDAVAALLDGRFDEVQPAADAALSVLEHPQPNDVNIHAGQTVLLHRELGTAGDLVPVMEEIVEREPGIVGFRAAYAVSIASSDPVAAAKQLDILAADDFNGLSLDVTYVGNLGLLAETCALLDDSARAPRLRQLLDPQSGTVIVTASTVGALGAADRFLGMLAVVLEDWDEAVARYEAAIALEERLAAPPLVARTKLWFASALEKCGRHERAATMRQEAEGLAASLGMQRVVVS